MTQLSELLDGVVQSATFDVGRISMPQEGISISYAGRPEERIGSQDLRAMFGSETVRASQYELASRAHVNALPEELSSLEDHVRRLLIEYIDLNTDRIGHAFPTGGRDESHYGYTTFTEDGRQSTEEWTSPVGSFTEALVRSAAVVGAEEVVGQLNRWVDEGEQINYRTAAILNGIALRDPIAPREGVRIQTLPFTLEEMPSHFPINYSREDDRYLGRTVLYIDHKASPALFNPESRRSGPAIVANRVTDVDFDVVCQALSLECDSLVEVGFFWDCYDVLQGLSRAYGGTRTSIGVQRFEPWPNAGGGLTSDNFDGASTILPSGSLPPYEPGPEISQERLGETIEAISNIDAVSGGLTGLLRWIKSKDRHQDLRDGFIDLRIALESLYVQTGRDELSFRLAIRGAWHLGESFDERKMIYEKLRKFYSKASRIVHGVSVGNEPESREILSESQDLCRRGIRKLLEDGPPDDWSDLVLGLGSES